MWPVCQFPRQAQQPSDSRYLRFLWQLGKSATEVTTLWRFKNMLIIIIIIIIINYYYYYYKRCACWPVHRLAILLVAASVIQR